MRRCIALLSIALSVACTSGEKRPAAEERPAVQEWSKEPVAAPAGEAPAPLTDEARAQWMSACSDRWLGDRAPPPPPPPSPLDPRWSRSSGGVVSPPPVPKAPSTPGALPRLRSADRLALALDLDDCSLAPLIRLEPDHRQDEGYHCLMAFAHDRCGDVESAVVWEQRRAEKFPQHDGALVAQAIRTLAALWPDPNSGMPYDERLAPETRLAIADAALRTLESIQRRHPGSTKAHVWAGMAHQQRQLARVVVDEPETPAQALQVLLARQDAMNVWREMKAIGDLKHLPDCGTSPTPPSPCMPSAPLSAEEVAADAVMWEVLTTGKAPE